MFDYRRNLVRNVDRKFFHFHPVNRYELSSIEEGDKRYYWVPVPDGTPAPEVPCLYKSVTTIIAEKADKTWLAEWKNAVGADKAERMVNSAKFRGKTIHQMAELYLYGQEYWHGHGTINIIDFNKIVPLLNTNVSHIYGIELPLYSHKFKTAGKTDLACRWDYVNSIVDFKTARKEKLKEQITDYFIQASCYAMMFEELYDYKMEQVVIIMLVDHEDKPQVFIEKVADWKGKVEEYFCGEK